jgi:rubrerythrin
MAMIDYSAHEVLTAARQWAQEGLEFYRAVAKHVTDRDVRELFLRLASEEMRLVGDIERMQEHADDYVPARRSSLLAQYIQRLVDTTVVRSVSEAEKIKGAVGGLVKAIALGIKAEQLAVEFYTKARDEAGSEAAADVFGRILEVEKRHLEVLTELRTRLTTNPPAKH